MFHVSLSLSSSVWEALGDLPSGEAMRKFTGMLLEKVPTFQPWLAERLHEKEEQERKERELQERLERERVERIAREKAERELQERLAREKAEQEKAEQERLERERAQAQALAQAQAQARAQAEQERLRAAEQTPVQAASPATPIDGAEATPASTSGSTLVASGLGEVAPHDLPYVSLPEFLESVKSKAECSFLISRGELVTIRVPNPEPRGVRIVWQFCTLDYDISFGLDYERTDGKTPQVDPVLPSIRCSSQEKVQVGTHSVHAPGNWLFNFDNTYSYFRSKQLYLRVACKPIA